MAVQGSTTIGANIQNLASGGADLYLYRKFTFATNVLLQKVSAAIAKSAASNATARAVVYSDSSNLPNTLLLSSTARIPANTSFAFEDFTFAGNPNPLSAGTYWIGMQGFYNGSGTATIAYDTGGTANGTVHQTSDINPTPVYENWNTSQNVTYDEVFIGFALSFI